MGAYPSPVEPSRVFGAAGQPAIGAAWVSYPGARAAAFYRDSQGLIHFEGALINNGGAVAVNDPIITGFPAGYLPSGTIFAVGGGWYVGATGIFSNQAGGVGTLLVVLNTVFRPV